LKKEISGPLLFQARTISPFLETARKPLRRVHGKLVEGRRKKLAGRAGMQ
jgi:hypothetical protein